MQALLTNVTICTAIAFFLLMVIDFTLGIVHLMRQSQASQPQSQPRPEEVFKIIDEDEKISTPPTLPQTYSEQSAQSAPQLAIAGGTVGSAAIRYETMSIRELKGLASSLKVRNYGRMRKAELIKAIRRC